MQSLNNDSESYMDIDCERQHIKYIPNIDPLGQIKSKCGIERLEEFVNDPAIKALSIALDEKGTMVLYEDVKSYCHSYFFFVPHYSNM